jgi:hypothetical protein
MRALSGSMFVRIFAIAIVATSLLGARNAISQTAAPRDIVLGQVHTVHSRILNQDRPYWVYLPPSYTSVLDYEDYH